LGTANQGKGQKGKQKHIFESFITHFYSQVELCNKYRKFEKSLTCSTIKAIFENKKDLFKGLAIEALFHIWRRAAIFLR
jgi:hypothetical protein